MSIFKGCSTAIVTPFNSIGSKINYKSFKKLIDFQINNGIRAIIFMGTTGEASTLTKSEKLAVAKFAINYVNHRVPVIIGSGSNNTADAVTNSIEFEKLGADALLVVTPYYNKATQGGLIEHYTAIASSVNIPIILYNVPSRTGVNIEAKTVYELSKIENIVAIKEASGNLSQVMDIRKLCDDSFDIYSGEDALTYPILALGGIGVISVTSNLMPREMCKICENFEQNLYMDSYDMQLRLMPLIKALFIEVNPIPIKTALNYKHFHVGTLRLPLTKMEQKNYKLLVKEIKNFI